VAYSLEEKYELIKSEILKSTSKDPLIIANKVMHSDYVAINGPEHHFLDGACFLMAYKNAGGIIDIDKALVELKERALKMPGAMCGYWGVCGSAASVGASLSIIHQTSPLSHDSFYKDNMEFTSSVLKIMGQIGGPRCCKRNAFISLTNGVEFVNKKYGVKMELTPIKCTFSSLNPDCLGRKCPFNKDLKEK